MHIFLTGPQDVGKTTVINKVLAKLEKQHSDKPLIVKGFRSFWGEDFAPRKSYAYIAHADCEFADLGAAAIALRDTSTWDMEIYPQTFDNIGVGILEYSKDADLILMDELGFMESEALDFRQKVMDVLDGNIPVIGVLKQDTEFFKDSPFLNGIRAHDKVCEIKVSVDNRDDLVEELVRIYDGIYMDRV